MSDQPRAPRPDVVDEIEAVEVRRSPRYGVFLLLGGVLGIIVAFILTFAFRGGDVGATGIVYTDGQVFGFLALIFVAAGVLLGGVVAIILDRTVGGRTRRLTADHASVHTGSTSG